MYDVCMKFPVMLQKENINWSSICKWSVLILLMLSILWRGGKSLDMTWILTGIATVVTIISHTVNRKIGDREVPLFLWIAVIAFALVTAVSYIYSTTQNYGLDEVLRTGSFVLLLLWIIREGSSEDGGLYINKILKVFCITTIAACVIGLFVYVFQPVDRAVGTFFDYRFHTDYWPNAWAEYLLMAWPILLYWILKNFQFDAKDGRSRIELLIRCIVLGIVFGCLFLTYSRGAMLVLIAQITLWAMFVYIKTKPHFPVSRIIPIAAVFLSISVITFLSANTLRSQYYQVQDVQEKVTFTASEGTSSISERGQFWSQAVILAAKKPLWGWGPYSFRFVQPQLQEGVLATSDHPHNVLLKLLVERGVFAGALFIMLVLIIARRSAAVLLTKEVYFTEVTFSISTFMVIGLFGVLLHNMIDYNLQFVAISLPLWLFFGVVMLNLDITSLKKVPVHIARMFELIIAITLLCLALYEGGYLVVSSFGRVAEAQQQNEKALIWYDRASGELFKRDLLLSKANLFIQEGSYNGAKQSLDAYIEANDEDYRAWKREGDIALLTGNNSEALYDYSRAYQRGKWNDLGVLYGLIETYLALDETEKITALRPEIDNLLAKYRVAIQNNAHFIALSTNVEEFISICNTMANLFPDNAALYEVWAANADHHAQMERERIHSRPPGFLW